jgi:arylsulfatase A-like enzyme
MYVDSELGRLYQQLDKMGILDNTYLILTSDHGEMFERGIMGHMTPSLHQPVINIPLLIFKPGAKTRVDIHSLTSAIDLLPTISYISGHDIPNWSEGTILPPFSSDINERVFALQVGAIDRNQTISDATAMLVEGQYKMNWYFGYEELDPEGDMIELYDLEADPEELLNLFPSRMDIAQKMQEVIISKLEGKLGTP